MSARHLMAARRRVIAYSGAPPSITWTDNEIQNSNSGTHTFTSKSIGAADPTRIVIVAIASTQTISGVTIGGITATVVTGTVVSAGTFKTAMYLAAVPTGTTATVVVTLGASGIAAIGVASMIYALSTTPTSTGTDNSNPLSFASKSVDAQGVALAYAFENNTSTWTWTVMNESFDVQASSLSHSGAVYSATSAATISPTATNGGSGTAVGCFAAFR